jgi:hypothetical protein
VIAIKLILSSALVAVALEETTRPMVLALVLIPKL